MTHTEDLTRAMLIDGTKVINIHTSERAEVEHNPDIRKSMRMLRLTSGDTTDLSVLEIITHWRKVS